MMVYNGAHNSLPLLVRLVVDDGDVSAEDLENKRLQHFSLISNTRQSLLNRVASELMTSERGEVLADTVDDLLLIFSSAILQHILHHVVPVLVHHEVSHTARVYFIINISQLFLVISIQSPSATPCTHNSASPNTSRSH